VISGIRDDEKIADAAAAASASPHGRTRPLAGATVLQIVPALRGNDRVRSALAAARALVQTGARAIVAGEAGELLDELRSFGGEWLPLATETINPGRLRSNADTLVRFVAAEHVDILHARNAGAAWSARTAANRSGIRLVTDLPDFPATRLGLAALYQRVLSRGDRVISHSMFHAKPMIERHDISPERISIIPRSIDLTRFDPMNVPYDRVLTLRRAWGIPSRTRIVLVPGRIAPRNGQITLVKAARILADNGGGGFTFVLTGDDRRHPRYARKFWNSARTEGVDALFRMVGHVGDMPPAFAAADLVVVTCQAPPADSRLLAQAQAMARPVITTAVGSLPEMIGAPPHTPFEQRSGWTVPPAQAAELAHAILTALALDPPTYRAHVARARAFAVRRFSPQSVAEATLDIYASLLVQAEPLNRS
jgi:glycosyltransferase involved in cell wall biosynthesis